MKYSPEQELAIHSPAKRILVSAAAGSGKTRVVVGRAARLLNQGIKPSEMVFVTFTAAAAKVMRQRLSDTDARFGINASNAQHVGTLHSYMLKLIRRVNASYSVLLPEDADEILEATAKVFKDKTNSDTLKGMRARWWQESQTLTVARMTPAQRTLQAYYTRLLADHLLDYDAILWRGLVALQRMPIESKIGALFVDEFQDSGDVDMAIYDTITAEYGMFVGDSDQAIYGFRGGRVAHIIALSKRENWAHVQLTTNYRSALKIVATGQRLIRHNQNRITLNSRADRQDDPGIVGLTILGDSRTHDQSICDAVIQQVASGIPVEEIAVLAATHSAVWAVSDALKKADIPVRSQTKADLPKDWKITRLLLALLAQPNNWGLAEIILRKVNGMDEFEINARRRGSATPRDHFKLPQIITPEVALNWLGRLGAGTDSVLAVRKWIDRCRPQDMQELHLGVMATDDTEITGNGVYVGTIHSAKGREWSVVHLAAVETGVLPFGSQTDAANIEEQRRLAYVGVTRARDQLWIYAAKWREFNYGQFSEKKDTGPSLFTEEMKP